MSAFSYSLDDAIRPSSRLPFGVGLGLFFFIVFVIAVWLIGSRNPYTHAGYVGYLTRGAVFGKSTFYGVQRGPTSSGRGWLLDVTNVSVTPYTYSDDFTGEDAVLSQGQSQDRLQGAHGVARERGADSALHGALQHDDGGRP